MLFLTYLGGYIPYHLTNRNNTVGFGKICYTVF